MNRVFQCVRHSMDFGVSVIADDPGTLIFPESPPLSIAFENVRNNAPARALLWALIQVLSMLKSCISRRILEVFPENPVF